MLFFGKTSIPVLLVSLVRSPTMIENPRSWLQCQSSQSTVPSSSLSKMINNIDSESHGIRQVPSFLGRQYCVSFKMGVFCCNKSALTENHITRLEGIKKENPASFACQSGELVVSRNDELSLSTGVPHE